ncbi:fatty acyl-CoA reductase 1-like isoform X2 [Pieris napi]|uniref:fatty acyl-CoA reductase 1-like isoform X2 n=1 Tax=Pieris napi TaxID=78633 RepID=UPI001FB9C5A4|nr:fatty acyl-CoA reductase 1-like isoform X2 [Pieris napi]
MFLYQVSQKMGFLEEQDLSNVPSITEYYKGKTIFVTGGSGFMGKVLLEKLLYSCSDLDRIYVLLRSKKGVNPEDRLAALYASECFSRLRKEKPGLFESKVFFIAGDCSEIGLGMSEEDRALIVNRAHIVFHVAASVRFDDTLKVAAGLNLRGTRELVELAKEIRNLEVLLHVSTSYANTNRDPIDEVVYPPHANWRDTLEVCEKMDEETLKHLTPKYLGELPNTYVFTKQLAEHVVYEQKGKLPVIIARPSIVISAIEEPLPGWIENFNGPVGILIASGKGILRSVYSDPDLAADYIPVDVAIKMFIAGAWLRGTKKLEATDEVEVYHCSSSHMQIMTVGEIVENGKEILNEIPLDNVLWAQDGGVTKSRLYYNLRVLLFHLLPAILVDLVLRIIGRKPMLFKIQRRIYTANIALHPYLTQQWKFLNKNLLALREKLKLEDKKMFNYAVEMVDQLEYFKTGVRAGKMYLLNEKLEDLPKAKAHYRRMVILDKTLRIALYSAVAWYVYSRDILFTALSYTYNAIIGL